MKKDVADAAKQTLEDPSSGKPLEKMKESSVFFRMSKYAEALDAKAGSGAASFDQELCWDVESSHVGRGVPGWLPVEWSAGKCVPPGTRHSFWAELALH